MIGGGVLLFAIIVGLIVDATIFANRREEAATVAAVDSKPQKVCTRDAFTFIETCVYK